MGTEAAEGLLGKIADGQTAAGAIEHRLQAGIADAQSATDTLTEAVSKAATSTQVLQVEVDAAEERSGRLVSVIQAAKQVDAVASSAVDKAASAAERLASKVQEGERVVEVIEDRLRTSLADGHSAIDTLNQIVTRAGDTADSLGAEMGAAQEKRGQIASVTAAAREATRQAQAVIAEAHQAADQLPGKMAAGANAVQDLEARLAAGIAEGRAVADSLGETIRESATSVHALEQRTGASAEQCGQIDNLVRALEQARERSASILGEARNTGDQLASRIADGEQALAGVGDRLEERLADGQAMTDALSELTARAGDVSGLLRVHVGAAEEKTNRLASTASAARQANHQTASAIEEAHAVAEQLGRATTDAQTAAETVRGRIETALADAQPAVEHLLENIQTALGDEGRAQRLSAEVGRAEKLHSDLRQTADRLAERREAARATLQRQQLLHERDQQLLEQLQSQIGAAEGLASSLSASTADAGRVHERLDKSCQGAGEKIERVAVQIEAVDARRQVLEVAEATLQEFVDHAESIGRQIGKLQGQADSFEVHVSRLLEKPERIVAGAQAQSDQLQEVCRVVRKVFASLSQATLQANRRIEQFSRLSRTAEGRASRLSTETARATETLRTWVAEAVQAQSRLTESLERCPTASQTHPAESLSGLASLARRQSLPEMDNLCEDLPADAPTTVGDPPAAANGIPLQAGTRARSRSEEISQLIAEAHKFAEGELAMAHDE